MRDLLNDPKVTAFDLSNQTYPYKQPRFIVFQKATEMACIENKPKSLRFLLKHPSYKELADCKKSFTHLTSFQKRNQSIPSVKRIIQNNFESQYIPAAAKEILLEAAEKCCELGRADCLNTLFQHDHRNWLQSGIWKLSEISKKHGSESCIKVIVHHIDTSEPLGWDPHK
jgi:predicted transport protein